MDNEFENPNSPKTEAELRRESYRTIAQNALTALGHADAAVNAARALQGHDDTGLKEAFRRSGYDISNFDQKLINTIAGSITSIPDKKAAKMLLSTAVSGIPVESGDTSDTVARFPIAVDSAGLTIDESDPYKQSKIIALPNLSGTQALLKSFLEKTGFINVDPNGVIFDKLKKELKGSNHIALTHPVNNRLSVSVDGPPKNIKKPRNPIDWAYNIQIYNSRI